MFILSLSCTSAWTHRLPILSDAGQPVSHPRAFRQRWMLINAMPSGGNASGLYLSPSDDFFFFFLFVFLTWTCMSENLLLLYPLIIFEWIAREKLRFSAMPFFRCVIQVTFVIFFSFSMKFCIFWNTTTSLSSSNPKQVEFGLCCRNTLNWNDNVGLSQKKGIPFCKIPTQIALSWSPSPHCS